MTLWKSRRASVSENPERQEANLPAVPFSLQKRRHIADCGRSVRPYTGDALSVSSFLWTDDTGAGQPSETANVRITFQVTSRLD
jgi:hypothetical protein